MSKYLPAIINQTQADTLVFSKMICLTDGYSLLYDLGTLNVFIDL